MRSLCWFAAFTLLAVAPAQERRVVPAGPSRRMALVIGNDAYPWKPLVNSVNDAKALAQLLPQLGFAAADITLVTNATLRQMQRAAREFVEKLRPDDLALLYYSGHGVEFRGENFLIPVEFPPNASEIEVRDEAYSAQQLLKSLEETHARVRLVILDACRDNPLRATRSGAGGLARMDGEGTLIVFATSAGKTADDNPRGGNGLFTSHLLKALPTPGLTLDQMIRQVAREVYQESKGRQLPAVYGLLLEDMAFVPGSAGVVSTPSVSPSASASVALPSELVRVQDGKPRVSVKEGLTYVWIPPGTFRMGCSSDANGNYNPNYTPAVQVRLSRGFWLGESEVTQAAYDRIIGNGASNFKAPDRPVEMVSWEEAAKYCAVVGGRLPTEAEWEYAARGGTTGMRYGSMDAIAWFVQNSGGQTHPVKRKLPNAYGLYDMLGNVEEWVADWYQDKLPGGGDPTGPATGARRVRRGGAWGPGSRIVSLRADFRGYADPASRSSNTGFRCAKD